MGAIAGPVYAEYNTATSQLVVANYDGGTISVIDVSLDQYGNDSPTFGTTYTIPVGPYPASVTVLYDGSRAYTANQGDCGTTCTASSNGTVTVVNLSSAHGGKDPARHRSSAHCGLHAEFALRQGLRRRAQQPTS